MEGSERCGDGPARSSEAAMLVRRPRASRHTGSQSIDVKMSAPDACRWRCRLIAKKRFEGERSGTPPFENNVAREGPGLLFRTLGQRPLRSFRLDEGACVDAAVGANRRVRRKGRDVRTHLRAGRRNRSGKAERDKEKRRTGADQDSHSSKSIKAEPCGPNKSLQLQRYRPVLSARKYYPPPPRSSLLAPRPSPSLLNPPPPTAPLSPASIRHVGC